MVHTPKLTLNINEKAISGNQFDLSLDTRMITFHCEKQSHTTTLILHASSHYTKSDVIQSHFEMEHFLISNYLVGNSQTRGDSSHGAPVIYRHSVLAGLCYLGIIKSDFQPHCLII